MAKHIMIPYTNISYNADTSDYNNKNRYTVKSFLDNIHKNPTTFIQKEKGGDIDLKWDLHRSVGEFGNLS